MKGNPSNRLKQPSQHTRETEKKNFLALLGIKLKVSGEIRPKVSDLVISSIPLYLRHGDGGPLVRGVGEIPVLRRRKISQCFSLMPFNIRPYQLFFQVLRWLSRTTEMFNNFFPRTTVLDKGPRVSIIYFAVAGGDGSRRSVKASPRSRTVCTRISCEDFGLYLLPKF